MKYVELAQTTHPCPSKARLAKGGGRKLFENGAARDGHQTRSNTYIHYAIRSPLLQLPLNTSRSLPSKTIRLKAGLFFLYLRRIPSIRPFKALRRNDIQITGNVTRRTGERPTRLPRVSLIKFEGQRSTPRLEFFKEAIPIPM